MPPLGLFGPGAGPTQKGQGQKMADAEGGGDVYPRTTTLTQTHPGFRCASLPLAPGRASRTPRRPGRPARVRSADRILACSRPGRVPPVCARAH